jgi:hypothetical protein
MSYLHHFLTEKHTFQHPFVNAIPQPKVGPTPNQSRHINPRHHLQLADRSRVQPWLSGGLCGHLGGSNDTFRVFSENTDQDGREE